MTANRWWVRLAARWLARIDGVRGQVQMFSLAITAFSTFSIMLQGFGLGRFVAPLGVGAVLVGIVYVYFYNEGGVRNQVSRDRQDLSNNYSAPAMLMDDTVTGVSNFVAINGRRPTEDEREMIEAAVREQWLEYRDGIDIQEAENVGSESEKVAGD